MKKLVFYTFGLSVLTFFLSNCASMTGLQDGRTVGKNNGEIMTALNITQSPKFNDLLDQDTFVDIQRFFIPSIEVMGQYGVGERVDIGLRLNNYLGLGINTKFQVVGDRESKFALAIGAEAATFSMVIPGLWNLQVPVFASVHPSDKLTWYITPRYTYQFTSVAGADNGWSYIGGNTGLLFGSRNKFGIDIGYYNVGYFDSSNTRQGLGMLNFGLGGKFKIGRN